MTTLADVLELEPAECGCGNRENLYKDEDAPAGKEILCGECMAKIRPITCTLCGDSATKDNDLMFCDDGAAYHYECAKGETIEIEAPAIYVSGEAI